MRSLAVTAFERTRPAARPSAPTTARPCQPQRLVQPVKALSLVAPARQKAGELSRFARLRQVKYLNNIVEQDHRRIKRLVRPGLGFGGFWTARRTLPGFEAMAMIRKGQIRNIRGDDIRAQANFIAGLFWNAA